MYEIVLRGSFLGDFKQLPTPEQKKAENQLDKLRADPFGPWSKKVLKHRFRNLYRVRLGQYRLLYTVGSGCVAPYAIGPRKEIYDRFDQEVAVPSDDLNPEAPLPLPTAVDDAVPATLPEGKDEAGAGSSGSEPARVLDNELLEGLLEFWEVPRRHWDRILACHDPDDLLDLPLDEEHLDKILHFRRPKTVSQLVEEPVLELPEPKDLERYAEGELTNFLLRLDDEQKEAAKRTARGPLLVRGGPGTGKSIVALYRIRNLFAPEAQRDLFAGEPPRVLFVTFTRALTNASRQLLKDLVGPVGMRNVTVETLDSAATRIAQGGSLPRRPPKRELSGLVGTARLKTEFPGIESERKRLREAVERLDPEYLLDEFEWVIDGWGIDTLDAYLEQSRSGRGVGLQRLSRTAVWHVYRTWRELLKAAEGMTYAQVEREALERIEGMPDEEKYDVVVLDEAQDLKPVGIRLAMALAKDLSGFYLTADAAQSIYGRGFSWASISSGLDLRGRSVVLRRNYRCTREIERAAVGFLRNLGIEEPEQESEAVRRGPRPEVIEHDGNATELIAGRFRSWSREVHLPFHMGAVLVRFRSYGQALAERLSEAGLPAVWVESGELDLRDQRVKVMTLHASKGLEFPMVVIAGVEEGVLPVREKLGQDPEDRKEVVAQEARLLHVGMSRAMRRLALVFKRGRASRFIGELDTDLWSWGA